MVQIAPFKGLFYNQQKISKLNKVLSPPYDIISPGFKKKISDFSPYNIVNLILPSKKDNKDKYENASYLLDRWLKEKILIFDNEEGYYLLEEEFKLNGSIRRIHGFIGLTKIEPYSTGKILRHENTLSKPKKDRLNLLKKTNTNFGLIYTIYKDKSNLIYEIIKKKQNPEISVNPSYDKTLNFKLWKIKDRDNIKNISSLLSDKPILIADGHHRYETSKLYSETAAKNVYPVSRKYILTFFVNSEQKDISIWPTFRLIKFKENRKFEDFLERLSKKFEVKFLENIDKKTIEEGLKKSKKLNKKCFYFYTGLNSGYLLTLKDGIKDRIENLDVNILHNLIIDTIIKKHNIEKISFSHSTAETIKNINSNIFDIAIFLNAPEISDVEELSAKGYLMPQKSTYFYPKPCTGLVMYKFYK